MELARHNRVSVVCNEIIGESWRHSQQQEFSQMPTSQKNDELCDSIAEYNTEKTDVQYDIKEVKAGVKHPGNLKPQVYNSMTTKRPMATAVDFESTPVKEIDRFDRIYYFFSGDEAVMRILSSPLFSAFSSKSDDRDWLQWTDDNRFRTLYERLATVLQRPSYSTGLVEILVERTSDEWLRAYMQTEDFDGTWVAIICGFYQSLYLYDTKMVEKHQLSRSSENERIVVLLLRLQHLQIYQRIVANKLQKYPSLQDFELLGSQEFLNSCLSDSLQETMNVLRRWEGHVLSQKCGKCLRTYYSHERFCLADILPRLLDGEHDIWLWKHLHPLDGIYAFSWKHTLIASLYQGLFLYENNDDHTKAEEITKGRLTALLFRSRHLKNFEDMLSRIFFSTAKVNIIQSHHNHEFKKLFLEASNLTSDFLKEVRYVHVMLELALSEKEKKEEYGNESSQLFLGRFYMGTMIEEPIDLKQVHALGGLICTIEGESSTSSSGDGLACTSWCIVRDTPTNLFFCVDLKNDVYENKNRVLDGESTIDYEGVIEVEIADGNTFVRSLESDGSSYNGCLEDFVDLRGKRNALPSCAEVALQNLPQSNCLKEANLKCSALHMLALAFSAGNKENLTLKWGSTGTGHIEYSTSLKGLGNQGQHSTYVALQKCTLVYTNEGKLVGEDIIWEGNGRQRSTDFQDHIPKKLCINALHGENKEEDTNGEELSEEEIEKADIILEQCKSWLRCGLIGDYSTMRKDRVLASLIKAHKEVKEVLVPVEAASASAQFKQNSGGGFGVGLFKIHGNHEFRSPGAKKIMKRFLQEFSMGKHLKSAVVVPRDLHNDDFNNLKVLLMNGRMKQHSREFFILKTKGSCTLQVFLCNPENYSQEFIWLTDIVLSDSSVAEEMFNDKLNGKSLTISRKDSDLCIDLDVAPNLLSRFHKRRQSQLQLISEETMIDEDRLQNFPRSRNAWKYIIGDSRVYNGKKYFWKATEYEAIICSATTYTTGGAVVRKQEKICDTSQASTSLNSQQQPSSSSSQQLISSLIHGSCEKVCSSFFEKEEDKVTTVGKFSTFKGISFWPHVYWG